ncbi:unnamed protein product, partial [Choristocarpus tenellus]
MECGSEAESGVVAVTGGVGVSGGAGAGGEVDMGEALRSGAGAVATLAVPVKVGKKPKAGGKNSKAKYKQPRRWSKQARSSQAPKQVEEQSFLKGDEVVHEYRRVCGPHYVLAQLLQWHNTGQGTLVNEAIGAELFGCVRLPDVLDAYRGGGAYTRSERMSLISHLEDPEKRKHPWPANLAEAFHGPGAGAVASSETDSGAGVELRSRVEGEDPPIVLGSPMVDAVLEDTKGLRQVLECLKGETGLGPGGVGGWGETRGRVGDTLMMEEDVPQCSASTPWAQCDLCFKWRRLPWHINPEKDLGSKFYCSDNKWNFEEASCDVS